MKTSTKGDAQIFLIEKIPILGIAEELAVDVGDYMLNSSAHKLNIYLRQFHKSRITDPSGDTVQPKSRCFVIVKMIRGKGIKAVDYYNTR